MLETANIRTENQAQTIDLEIKNIEANIEAKEFRKELLSIV
jgi:hypothetical protein